MNVRFATTWIIETFLVLEVRHRYRCGQGSAKVLGRVTPFPGRMGSRSATSQCLTQLTNLFVELSPVRCLEDRSLSVVRSLLQPHCVPATRMATSEAEQGT